MKFNFQQTSPLYCNQGDFALEQITSKDLFIENSPEQPINKLQLLKQKKQKSLDLRVLNKSSASIQQEKFLKTPEKDNSFSHFLQKEKDFQQKSSENLQKLKEMLQFQEALEFSATPKINKVLFLNNFFKF